MILFSNRKIAVTTEQRFSIYGMLTCRMSFAVGRDRLEIILSEEVKMSQVNVGVKF
jgi:hypothetical protein